METRRERLKAKATKIKSDRAPKTLSLKRTTIEALKVLALDWGTDESKVVDLLVEDLDDDSA